MSRWIKGISVIAVVLALALPAQAEKVTQRPLSDFLNAQGTTPPFPPNSYVPPDPNFLGFSTIMPQFLDPSFAKRGWVKKSDRILFAGVDYAGLAAAYENQLSPNSMQIPEITGTVIERELPDGTAEVTVLLHTKGANIWVIELSGDPSLWGDEIAGTAPTLFGHRPRDVAAGATPALADTILHWVFIINAPGDPLPDLLTINYTPAVKFAAFNARGEGPLTNDFVPGGAPGKCTIVQTGLFDVVFSGKVSGKSRVAADFFPVENINLQVVGK